MIKGYNDNFTGYAGWNEPFDRALAGGSNIVRFPLVWPDYQGWASSDPNAPLTTPNFDSLSSLRGQLYRTGLKALPVVLSSPFNGTHQGDGFGTTAGGFTYPTGPNNRTKLGDFVVAVLRSFNPDAGCNLIDSIEIWNEPTKPNDRYTIPNAADFVNMCQASASAVYSANDAGTFTTNKKVISGGMYMNGNWEPYFDQVVNGAKALCTYQLGIHPYYYYNDNQRPTNKQNYIDKARDETLQRVDTARYRMILQGVSTNQLWVTEVATTSQPPWGYDGQNDAIKQIIDGLKNRSFVGACIVHRLFQDNFLEPNGSLLHQCNVCDGSAPYAPPKLAYSGIANRWAGW